MRLFFRFMWPRSWRSLGAWTPLIVVGFIACIGLSLALGFRAGVLARHDAATLRDGGSGWAPRLAPADSPLRSSEVAATVYGPLVVTVFWGDAGEQLGLPGIPQVGAGGTALASPEVLSQLEDDWTGELRAWLGDRPVQTLPDAALAHPSELVIVRFTDTLPAEGAERFHPIREGRSWAPDTGFIVVGLLILVLPSVALARAGAAVHLNARSRRYGLLRALGATPRQLALGIAADMAIPLLGGALLGSVAYALVMSSLGSFSFAGNSYWASDLRLPITLGIALPLVTIAAGLMSVARIVHRAGGDPLGTLRRDRRRRVSYGALLLAAGAVAGPVAIAAAAEVDFALAGWLITAGLLLSVLGLEGLSRIAVAVTGSVLVNRTRLHLAGSRMSRSGADALLGVSATAVAVLLIVFVLYSNFDNRPSPTGTFDVVVSLPQSPEPEPVVNAVAGIDGVTRVVAVGMERVDIDHYEGTLYTMTCEDAAGSVELDGPCVAGSVYPVRRLADADTVTIYRIPNNPNSSPNNPNSPGGPVFLGAGGVHPVGGKVTASWLPASSNIQAVQILEQPPTTPRTTLLVTTDGAPGSLRRVIEGLRNRPEESYATTQAALTSGRDEDSLTFLPYMFAMAATAAGMAVVALLYAVLLLFRQRQAEFRMLRCQGATRMLLAVDLGFLFAAPLLLAFGLAVASGLAMAAAYNTAFGVPASQVNPQGISVLAVVLATGVAATVLVSGMAARTPAFVPDPDATAV